MYIQVYIPVCTGYAPTVHEATRWVSHIHLAIRHQLAQHGFRETCMVAAEACSRGCRVGAG